MILKAEFSKTYLVTILKENHGSERPIIFILSQFSPNRSYCSSLLFALYKERRYLKKINGSYRRKTPLLLHCYVYKTYIFQLKENLLIMISNTTERLFVVYISTFSQKMWFFPHVRNLTLINGPFSCQINVLFGPIFTNSALWAGEL